MVMLLVSETDSTEIEKASLFYVRHVPELVRLRAADALRQPAAGDERRRAHPTLPRAPLVPAQRPVRAAGRVAQRLLVLACQRVAAVRSEARLELEGDAALKRRCFQDCS